jgi:hypothetical protein
MSLTGCKRCIALARFFGRSKERLWHRVQQISCGSEGEWRGPAANASPLLGMCDSPPPPAAAPGEPREPLRASPPAGCRRAVSMLKHAYTLLACIVFSRETTSVMERVIPPPLSAREPVEESSDARLV